MVKVKFCRIHGSFMVGGVRSHGATPSHPEVARPACRAMGEDDLQLLGKLHDSNCWSLPQGNPTNLWLRLTSTSGTDWKAAILELHGKGNMESLALVGRVPALATAKLSKLQSRRPEGRGSSPHAQRGSSPHAQGGSPAHTFRGSPAHTDPYVPYILLGWVRWMGWVGEPQGS